MSKTTAGSGLNIKYMQPHQQRVVDEKSELDEKLSKLSIFISGEIFKTLPNDEQERLTLQQFHMGQYSMILQQRIDNF